MAVEEIVDVDVRHAGSVCVLLGLHLVKRVRLDESPAGMGSRVACLGSRTFPMVGQKDEAIAFDYGPDS